MSINFLDQIGGSLDPVEISQINSGDRVLIGDDPIFGGFDEVVNADRQTEITVIEQTEFDVFKTIDAITGLGNLGLNIFQGIAAFDLAKGEQEIKEDLANAQIDILKSKNAKQLELINVQIKAATQSLDFQSKLNQSQLNVVDAKALTAQVEEKLKQELLKIQISAISPPEINEEISEKIAGIEENTGVSFNDNERNRIKEQLLEIHFPELKNVKDLTIKDGQIISLTGGESFLIPAIGLVVIGIFLIRR